MHAAGMLSRVRNHFRGAKFARMSSGTYCVIRDLGLVKGGKGMRHHEVLVTFSFRAAWRVVGRVWGRLVGAGTRWGPSNRATLASMSAFCASTVLAS